MPSGPVGSRASRSRSTPQPSSPVVIPDRSFVARNGGFATILRDRTPAAESREVLDEYIRKEMAGDLAGQARDVKLGRVVMLPAQTRFEILSIEEPDPAGGEAATFEFHREHPAGELVKINIVGSPKAGATFFACRADVGRMIEAPAGSVAPDDPAASQVRIAVPRSAKVVQLAKASAALARAEAIEDAGRTDEVLRAYRAIIADYPETTSAVRAKEHADALTGKPRRK
jgi:hypothetical protein